MVLVDGRTTGAAELLAATLSGTGRGAMIIGQPTAGDPGIRQRVSLSSGEELYLATRRLVVAGEDKYSGQDRVRPDIYVDPAVRYVDYEPEEPLLTDRRETTRRELETRALRLHIRGDAALTRAMDVLIGLKALNFHRFGDAGAQPR
jgi:C-terminal processing protease CtpA/Prc